MVKRAFVMGDIHGQVGRIRDFCKDEKTTTNDILILLGDVGFNYNFNEYDRVRKEFVSKLPITLLCIHGNHEERPNNIQSYIVRNYEKFQCNCWVEDEYSNILFPFDGKIVINGKNILIMGGAYSVDKYYRLANGKRWFESEQMPESTKNYIRTLVKEEKNFDYVLTHTAPLSEEPTFLFLSGIDQSTVEKGMETFLEEIKNKIRYNHWYFGHYHYDGNLLRNFTILYKSYIALE
jgi:predicted phosphodiesterase